jgi:hypothetical protein
LKSSFIFKKDSIGKTFFDEVITYFPSSFNLNGIERKYTTGFVPLDYTRLKKDPKFRMQLVEIDQFRVHKISYYEQAKTTMKLIVDLIERE